MIALKSAMRIVGRLFDWIKRCFWKIESMWWGYYLEIMRVKIVFRVIRVLRKYSEWLLLKNVIRISDFGQVGKLFGFWFCWIGCGLCRVFLTNRFFFPSFPIFCAKNFLHRIFFRKNISSLEFTMATEFSGKSLKNTSKSASWFFKLLLEHNCYYVK